MLWWSLSDTKELWRRKVLFLPLSCWSVIRVVLLWQSLWIWFDIVSAVVVISDAPFWRNQAVTLCLITSYLGSFNVSFFMLVCLVIVFDAWMVYNGWPCLFFVASLLGVFVQFCLLFTWKLKSSFIIFWKRVTRMVFFCVPWEKKTGL